MAFILAVPFNRSCTERTKYRRLRRDRDFHVSYSENLLRDDANDNFVPTRAPNEMN